MPGLISLPRPTRENTAVVSKVLNQNVQPNTENAGHDGCLQTFRGTLWSLGESSGRLYFAVLEVGADVATIRFPGTSCFTKEEKEQNIVIIQPPIQQKPLDPCRDVGGKFLIGTEAQVWERLCVEDIAVLNLLVHDVVVVNGLLDDVVVVKLSCRRLLPWRGGL